MREGQAPRLFLLHSGRVQVAYTNDEGFESVVKILGPGTSFGEVELFCDGPVEAQVTALEPVVASSFSAERFRSWVDAFPKLSAALLRDVSQKFRRSFHNERLLLFGDVEQRLANFFLALLDAQDIRSGRLAYKLSQDDLARSLGVHRRSVTRALARFKDQGMLTKRGGQFHILSRAALEQSAGRTRSTLTFTSSG